MASTAVSRTFNASSLLKETPRFVLIALFAFAGIDKLLHLQGFFNAVGSYNLLPAGLVRPAAIFFILAEFAIAFGLLTRRWRRPACLAAILLLGFFTAVYLAVNPAGTCGCWFTLTLSSGGYFHILQNLVFIGLAILAWMDSSKLTPGPSSIPTPGRHSTAPQRSDDGRLKEALD